MNWFIKTLTSSIGRKLLMSCTGLFLCLFLVIHVAGNLQLFVPDNGYSFNVYADFLSTFIPIKIIAYILYLCILLHALTALLITLRNQKARPAKYEASNANANSRWNSRNMGILGTILFVFIVIHMANFWYQYKFGEVAYTKYTIDQRTDAIQNVEHFTSQTYPAETISQVSLPNENTKIVVIKDLYSEVADTFQHQWWIDILYLIGVLALAYHLIHGFWSAFQTLGIDNRKYLPVIKWLGIWVFGILIPLGFATMPLYFLLFFKK